MNRLHNPATLMVVLTGLTTAQTISGRKALPVPDPQFESKIKKTFQEYIPSQEACRSKSTA